MKKLSFLIVFIMFINLAIPKVQANESGTNLGGIINSDTILTAANSPYYLTKDLQLAEGTKLTIEEGVTIDGKGFSLTAWGALEIRGTSDQVVQINNLHIYTGSQSYYSEALPPTIDIQFAHINGGSLLAPGGNSGVGNLSLRDSTLKEVEEYGYSHIWYPTEDVFIERNIFINAGKLDIGISNNIKVYINNNVFYNDRERTYYNDADIVNWASYSESEVLVRNNSFLSPKGYSLKLAEGHDQTSIDGRENYWGTVDETEISNKIFDKNDDLRAASYIEYLPYLEEPHIDTPEFHHMKIPLPNVFTVYDYSTVVEGHLGIKIAGGKVIVKDWAGEVLGVQEGYEGETDFKVSIPKQYAESILYVTIVDQYGNESEPSQLFVEDGTPPKAPTVYALTDVSLDISGKTEPHISVKSVTSEGKFLGETQSDKDGEFAIPIEMQKAGTKIIVTAIDYMSNVSDKTSVIVKDGTPPSIAVMNKVTHHSTRVIGTAEADAQIEVLAGTTSIGKAKADSTGKYEVTIAKQKMGTKLSIVATDAAGNNSKPILVTVADGNYPDLKTTHWALEEIMYLADDQIIGGYPNGGFQSEKKTTRAEAAKMLVLALDLPLNDVSSGYKDVASKHWAKNYIAAASKAGLFNGNPDGTFAPDKTLKRSEMAKIISIAYDFKASGQNHFTDVKSGYWAKGYISGLYENGITTGYPDDTFRAEESTTRAEFSVFLARALNSEFR
ncbi:S-layer homology domain-containing protein [Planomicrobium okeanokoites]|uniref:S-layer homology domain-containing protein n=1 Tax=Planomicrobium okeanokoites TaxID=244 RepID=UPI0015C4DFEB|nr:S-layer homology domain-containing protein [Planomicrobium okeanokoites]